MLFSFLGGGLGERLFEGGHLLTFPTYRVGAYSRRVLIRGWVVNRVKFNMVAKADREADFPSVFSMDFNSVHKHFR